ncbi:peptidoglycan recognition protein family protein [Mycobacterium sp. MBM]|nr:peptidoglycan recognition protein family protein [Mycobacterium sp. MBM]
MSVPEVPGRDHRTFSRRQALWVAGGAGLAAVAAACSSRNDEQPSASTSVDAGPPPPEQPAQSSQPPVPALAAASALLLCRDAWGAAAPAPGGVAHTITRMTLHHTAVSLGDNSNAPGRLRQHQQYHQGTQGWVDIAYHLSVDRNGNIYELRRPEIAGDTATSYDPAGHFLVLCEGNFEEEEVSEAQLHGAAMAFAWASRQFQISTDTLGGHRDAAPDTVCPGTNLYSRLSSGELRRRVEDLLVAGGVDLQPICGPEAGAIVAEIEAGTQPQKY